MSLRPREKNPKYTKQRTTLRMSPPIKKVGGKIKNWKAGQVGPMGERAWTHATLNWYVDIENVSRGDWCITVTDPTPEGISIGDASNERAARQIAIDWMRNHPNPPAEEIYKPKEKKVIPWVHYNKVSWSRKNIIIKAEQYANTTHWFINIYKDGEIVYQISAAKSQAGAIRIAESIVAGKYIPKGTKRLLK